MARYTALIALVLLASVLGTAYAQVPSYKSFYEALSKRSDMKTVKAAVDALGLVSYLSDANRKITVFVPDDTAFMNLVKAYPILAPLADVKKVKTLNTFQKDMLRKVLYTHMVDGVKTTGTLNKGVVLKTFNAPSTLTVAMKGTNVPKSGGFLPTLQAQGNKAQVKLANVKCGAGVAHVVGTPLLPFPASTIKSLAG